MNGRRPRPRLLVGLLSALALGGLGAIAPTAAAVTSPPPAPQFPGGGTGTETVSPSPSTNTSPSLQIRLNALRPIAPQPGDTLTITGSVRNATDQPVINAAIALDVGSALQTRSDFDDYADDPTGPLPPVTLARGPQALTATRLLPDRSVPFTLSVPVDALVPGVETWQVRELALAASAINTVGVPVSGDLRTFLPWAPKNATNRGLPVRLAWVWPLVDRPHRSTGSAWLDADLAAQLGSGGRLANLLGAADAAAVQRAAGRHGKPPVRPVPVTYAIDPMLVDDVAAMSGGYTVVHGSGTTPGPGSSEARSWLATLRAAVARPDSEVIPLPYADPDVVAAVRNGLATEVGVATASGKSLLQHELPGSTLLTTAWPDDGYIDQRSVQALYASGITDLVLSDGALPVIGGPPSETPSAHVDVVTDGADLSGVLVDDGLADDVTAGVGPQADRGEALSRFLAETLMIQTEYPNDRRDLVVAPDRRWDPPAGYADALLRDSGRVPWLDPVPLSQVESSPVWTKVDRSPLTYPASARRQELPSSYLKSVKALQSAASVFGSILPAGDPAVRGYETDVERDLSSAYRDDPGRDSRVAADQASLAAAMRSVRIASAGGSFVTLTSHHGSVPITIANDLDTDVRVVLQVEPNQRLALSHGGLKTQVIPAHQREAVDVHMSAKTSGVFPLTVQLLTPSGRPYGDKVQLNVRSTVYGTITLAITGAAMAALLIAVGVRLSRRALAARRRALVTP